MVLITGNTRIWLVGTVISLIIFGVLYFTVIKPDNNTANQALRTGLQQSQQVLNQAQKQINSAAQSSGVNSAAAQQVVNKASQLSSCIAAAGTDVSQAQACAAKFGK
jgi:membrane-bound ClpP family serine protease